MYLVSQTLPRKINQHCREGEWMIAQSLLENNLDLFQQDSVSRLLTNDSKKLLQKLLK